MDEVIAVSEAIMGLDGTVHRIATMRIDENLYGADGMQSVKVVMLGGTYHGSEYEYLDVKQFAISDKVSLVLDENPETKKNASFL